MFRNILKAFLKKYEFSLPDILTAQIKEVKQP